MAFPTVQATNTTSGSAATTSATVNLPTTTANDIGKLLVSVHRSAGAGAHGWPTGWTEVFEDSSDATDDITSWAWKKVAGAEGTTMTVTQGNFKFANMVWLFTGAPDPAVQPPQSGTVAVGTGTGPDPGSVTPTGGAKDYRYIAISAADGESNLPPTFPTNYTLDQLSQGSGVGGATTTNVRIAGGGRDLNAASADPGAYTLSAAPAGWTAFTIAIHPAPPMYDDDPQNPQRVMDVDRAIQVFI